MEETQKAKEILNRFEDFVNQLLSEFEDHPALLQVNELTAKFNRNPFLSLLSSHYDQVLYKSQQRYFFSREA